MPKFPTALRAPRLARFIGVVITLLSLAGGAIGFYMVQRLGDDVRSSVSVSRSALVAISQTIAAVDDVAARTADSLASAGDSVAEVSATVEGAVTTIEGVADFLDEELPETLDAIQMSMPAAVQAAGAIDGTLRALTLFGVEYNPDESFGASLSRVRTALATLPGEMRAQSDDLALLVPSAQALVEETDGLASSMSALKESLDGFTSLTENYEATLRTAEATIESTSNSVDATIWLMRALVIAAAVAGIGTGIALSAIGRSLGELHLRTEAPIVTPRELADVGSHGPSAGA